MCRRNSVNGGVREAESETQCQTENDTQKEVMKIGRRKKNLKEREKLSENERVK